MCVCVCVYLCVLSLYPFVLALLYTAGCTINTVTVGDDLSKLARTSQKLCIVRVQL